MSAAAPQSGEITVRVTSGKMRYESAPSLAWRAAGPAAENVIELNLAKKYQEILGFGAAFTDAACYTFNRLDAPVREQLFHELIRDYIYSAFPLDELDKDRCSL